MSFVPAMHANPYQSPATQVHPAPDPQYRQQALVGFRRALVILTVPAALNYAAFDLVAIGLSDLPGHIATWYRAVNVAAFVAGFAALWYVGLPLLEILAQSIRLVVARETDDQEWMVPFFFMVRSFTGPAVAGGLLWLGWVVAIYFFGANFFVVSWGVAIPSALLVGVLILPLVFRWREMARPESVDLM